MARLSQRDARTWHRLAARIEEAIDPRLSPRVLANRGVLRTGPSPVGPLLRRARSAARGLGASYAGVLRTDVRSFYASVTPSVAFRCLVDLDVEPQVASRTADMLDGWGSEGYAGLPIGPPGSAVIANAVLASVDAELDSFIRWVDDYVITLRNERDLPRILERLDETLARIGLERSEPKTEVEGRGSSLVWPGTYVVR